MPVCVHPNRRQTLSSVLFQVRQFAYEHLTVVQCYGHAEQQVVSMELDRREAEAKEAEKRLQKLGAVH